MAQYGRPSADTYIGNYKDQGDGASNIYQAIDEASPSDADYIKSESGPSASPYCAALTTLEDPLSSSGHVFRYRFRKSAAGGAQINIKAQLRQGYVNEGTPGTLIKEIEHVDVGESWTTNPYTLSAGEADAITDYTSLFIRFESNQV